MAYIDNHDVFFFFQPTIQASNLDKLNKRKNTHLVQGKGENKKRGPRNNTHEHKSKDGGQKEQPKS
jgi:hypothetical protein